MAKTATPKTEGFKKLAKELKEEGIAEEVALQKLQNAEFDIANLENRKGRRIAMKIIRKGEKVRSQPDINLPLHEDEPAGFNPQNIGGNAAPRSHQKKG